jgi:threonine dehydrogenase-like Zn-dependent dehydrogenase
LIGAHTHARPKYESSGGWWTERDDAKSLLKLLSGGRINLATLVEEVHSPDEAPEVFARLANDASFPITQFDWSKMK